MTTPDTDVRHFVEGSSAYLSLGGIIARLEREDPDRILPIGFHEPHSFRGYYDELAFDITANIRVGDVLDACRSALGETYEGYKGGSYTMTEDTDCWIAEWGASSDNRIGPLLLELLLATPPGTKPGFDPEELREMASRLLTAANEAEAGR